MPTDPAVLVQQLEALIDGGLEDAYVRAELPASEHLLFLHKGKVWFGGAIRGGEFVQQTAREFFATIAGARGAELVTTEAPLFLCLAVLFQKAPAGQLPGGLGPDALVAAVRTTAPEGAFQVLLLRRGETCSVALFRQAVPISLFAAEDFPRRATIAERLAAYAMLPGVMLDVYADVRLRQGPDAGLPIRDYLRRGEITAAPILQVRLGGRTVLRYEVLKDETTVGRRRGNDLELASPTVSRRHAKIYRFPDLLVVKDAGSENGLVFKGQRVTQAALTRGDEVEIGSYHILFAKEGVPVEETGEQPIVVTREGEELETMMVSSRVAGLLEHRETTHKIRGLAFTIGAGAEANLRIEGPSIAGVHVCLLRDPSGNHTVTHIAGGSPMVVNGKPQKTATLVDGDVITLDQERIVFRLRGAGLRADLRHDAVLPVRYADAAAFAVEWTANISKGGLFVRTETPPPKGTEVVLAVLLPGAPSEVRLRGTVAYAVSPEEAKSANRIPGAGVKLAALDPSAAVAFEAYVKALEQEKRGRAVVVEGDTAIADEIAGALRVERFDVERAASPMRALKCLRVGRVDLVVSDLFAPAADGLELREHLRLTPALAEVPFVLLAEKPERYASAAAMLGIKHVLAKPFTASALRAAVRELFQRDPLTEAPVSPAKPLSADATVRLAISIDELVKKQKTFDVRDAFVLSRLACGPVRVSDLVKLCPQPAPEVHDVLRRFAASGVISVS